MPFGDVEASTSESSHTTQEVVGAMRLAYAMLADAADFTANGTFSILGGEIGILRAEEFPLFSVRLAVVVKLIVEPEECDRDHVLGLVLAGPDNLLYPRLDAPFAPREAGVSPIKQLLVLDLPFLAFPAPGEYEWRLTVDGAPIGEIPLKVTREDAGTAQAIPASNE